MSVGSARKESVNSWKTTWQRIGQCESQVNHHYCQKLGDLFLPWTRQPSISALRQMVPLKYQVWGLMRMKRAAVGTGRSPRIGVSGFWFPSKICAIQWDTLNIFGSPVKITTLTRKARQQLETEWPTTTRTAQPSQSLLYSRLYINIFLMDYCSILCDTDICGCQKMNPTGFKATKHCTGIKINNVTWQLVALMLQLAGSHSKKKEEEDGDEEEEEEEHGGWKLLLIFWLLEFNQKKQTCRESMGHFFQLWLIIRGKRVKVAPGSAHQELIICFLTLMLVFEILTDQQTNKRDGDKTSLGKTLRTTTGQRIFCFSSSSLEKTLTVQLTHVWRWTENVPSVLVAGFKVHRGVFNFDYTP